jgi:hypothetical protein
VLENNLTAEGQPQPRPILASGEERLEQMLPNIRRNAWPGIGKTNLNRVFLRVMAATTTQPPTLGHGLQRIGRQVQKHLT